MNPPPARTIFAAFETVVVASTYLLFAGTEPTCAPCAFSQDTTAATCPAVGENLARYCAGVRNFP